MRFRHPLQMVIEERCQVQTKSLSSLQVDHLGANGAAEDVDEEDAVEHAVATAGPEEDAQPEEHLSEAVPEHKDEVAAPAGDDAEEDWGLDEDEPGQ